MKTWAIWQMPTTQYSWQKYIIHDKLRLRGTSQHYNFPGKIALYLINLGCVIYDNTVIYLAK